MLLTTVTNMYVCVKFVILSFVFGWFLLFFSFTVVLFSTVV